MPPVEISLTATDIAYDKNQLEVNANQPVKLTLINHGSLEHDFSILKIPNKSETKDEMGGHDMSEMESMPELHVNAPLNGQSILEFIPTTAGSYEFFCTVAGHKEAGMVGTLIVKNS